MKLDIAIVNYNTDFYLRNLLASIAAQLPGDCLNGVHVWDNGSDDRSLDVLEAFGRSVPWLRVHRSGVNLHHGPALDALLRHHCDQDWVLVLDSDAAISRNFLPFIMPLLHESPAFVGQVHPQMPQLYAYLAHVLINRSWYLTLPPFKHHGAPGIEYFRAIEVQQIPFRRFRWCDHVQHFGQGALRQLVYRKETTNEFYEFAMNESREASAGRLSMEAELKMALETFLPERPGAPGREPGTHQSRPSAPMQSNGGNSSRWSRKPPSVDGSRFRSWLGHPVRGWQIRKARRLGLVQRDPEIRELLTVVARLQPQRLLEIGTGHGGSFYLWTVAAPADAVIVSIDLPPWELDDPGEAQKLRQLQRLGRGTQRVHCIRADSHAVSSRESLGRVLGSAPLDFLFIDGDHSYAGVKRDWLDYAPLVRPGGLIALHDIHPHSRKWGGEVPDFWREISACHRSSEIVADPTQDGFGIGLIRA